MMDDDEAVDIAFPDDKDKADDKSGK
jgi:hypothetical protein